MKHRWMMSINLYALILINTYNTELAEQAYADNCGWGINGWKVWVLEVSR